MSNIILTGFMGTGKTSVGKLVAKKLNRSFVDTDRIIEMKAQKSIPRIFSEDGEAKFRHLETILCKELEAEDKFIISTGGGMLLDINNRKIMGNSGIIICLSCSVDEIIRRLKKENTIKRPLLNVADPHAEIERLLIKRSESYATIPWQIDTTDMAELDVADKVIEISKAHTLAVKYPNGQYNIHIGSGILDNIGGLLHASGSHAGSRIAIISNPTIATLYLDRVEKSISSMGFYPFFCSIPDGEQYKNLNSVVLIYDQLLANRFDRNDTVLALGGGVVGDIAGMAAATFMRGIRFAQAPTTLLAMVDSSIGGKTGVNLPQGKNLIGTFKQPEVVVIDPSTLATLPDEEIRSGLAEVIKHGIINAPDILANMENNNASLSLIWNAPIGIQWIERSLQVKIDVVEHDPFEKGYRVVLNLGHTIGHALETVSEFR